MSLAVWLPLNGNLKNQGLDSAIFSNSSNLSWKDGKIGQKSLYTATGSYGTIVPSLIDKQQFSICYWIKTDITLPSSSYVPAWRLWYTNNVNTGYIRHETAYIDENTKGKHQIILYKENNTGGNANTFYTALNSNGIEIYGGEASTWMHCTLTKDLTVTKIYINGILRTTINNTKYEISPGKLTGQVDIGGISSNANFYLNDVRIYDHCLSPKEVEEISKGLILHYPLNNNGLGNTNLALNTFYEMRPYTIPSYYLGTNNTSTDFFGLFVGDTYTCRVKITAGEKDTRLRIQFYTNGNTRTSIFGNWIAAGTTGYSIITSTLTAEQRNHSLMEILLDDGVNASTSGEYGELKLEKGSIATPWCPNNINTNIIYDTSGYCNNGIVVGDITTITPSPRYNCCIEHLDSCADYIYREYLSFLGDSGFTFSCWINPTSYSRTTNNVTAVGNQFILSQGRDTIASGTNNTRGASLIIYNGKPQFFCGNGSLYSNTTIPIGEWAHVVGVWTGTQKKIYVNGILKNSANDTGIDWIEAQNSLVIGKMAYYKNSTSSFHPFVGKISDVRIYATALTDNQIKELYNTSMQIDSSGNVFARELVEL